MVLFFSIAPVTPPPQPPMELYISAEALPGKEVEFEAIERESQEIPRFFLEPQSQIETQKIVTRRYNRRGNRNK